MIFFKVYIIPVAPTYWIPLYSVNAYIAYIEAYIAYNAYIEVPDLFLSCYYSGKYLFELDNSNY